MWAILERGAYLSIWSIFTWGPEKGGGYSLGGPDKGRVYLLSRSRYLNNPSEVVLYTKEGRQFVSEFVLALFFVPLHLFEILRMREFLTLPTKDPDSNIGGC